MRYQKITSYDVDNGIGMRVVLWVSGCTHQCVACHNPQTWNVDSGNIFIAKQVDLIYSLLDKEYISGITFSGGDPLHEANRQAIQQLSKDIRELYPNKNQWLYTGYTWSEIVNDKLLFDTIQNIDVLVDEPFDITKKDMRLKWRGSSNQHIIDVQESIKEKKMILFDC